VSESEQDRFGARYRIDADVMTEIELVALGTDYGANGYTTLDQAIDIGERLGLGDDSVLLDLGSGCGWPGLYFASEYGCRLVSVDPVHSGVSRSVTRARDDAIDDRHLAVVGNGVALPVRDRSVDALVHVDVLC
jgi:cyclopropane fatty-acyl-phospholipid synthase-like methyltransferase